MLGQLTPKAVQAQSGVKEVLHASDEYQSPGRNARLDCQESLKGNGRRGPGTVSCGIMMLTSGDLTTKTDRWAGLDTLHA